MGTVPEIKPEEIENLKPKNRVEFQLYVLIYNTRKEQHHPEMEMYKNKNYRTDQFQFHILKLEKSELPET